jgi:purine-nucleoside/S-methyl-5'-thioadenosine phosphorylase / adenosine deaminase
MVTSDKAKFCASPLAAQDGLAHGFFTRMGGVSSGIYESLNCGNGSRDDAANVRENRARVAEHLGVAPARLITPYQKHSATPVTADAPWPQDRAPEADAVVTAVPGLAIGILTADCAPVLFADPGARIVGAAHAGWRGAISGILEATVEAMVSLGADRANIIAAIGPAISVTAYEVGEDYKAAFLKQDPAAEPCFLTDESTGEPHFDLPAYVAERLQRGGISEIFDLGLCTYCDEARLYSYRRSQHWGEEDYGRQISAIVLT